MAIRVDHGGLHAPPVDDVSTDQATAERVSTFRAAFGSEAAFRELYERALPRVYGYLANRCHGDVALAEDLTQEAFTEVLRVRGSYDGRADAITWMIGIARHRLLDHLRAEARDERRRMHLVVRELALDPGSRTWQEADDRAQLEVALGHLPARQRAVLILHYADGLPIREVARALGRSESATESLLGRARVALRETWREAFDG